MRSFADDVIRMAEQRVPTTAFGCEEDAYKMSWAEIHAHRDRLARDLWIDRLKMEVQVKRCQQ